MNCTLVARTLSEGVRDSRREEGRYTEARSTSDLWGRDLSAVLTWGGKGYTSMNTHTYSNTHIGN